MAETTENTLSAYLGPEFQQRLIWQLLVEPEFAEKIIPDLAIEYFDDPNLKRLFIIMLEYFKEFDKVPNLQNQSIHQAIKRYKTPNNIIEEESLFAIIKRIEFWNERIINKQMLYDGDVVQISANSFIKQQEYRKAAENVLDKVKTGEIKSKYVIAAIEERFQKISHIGEEDDDSESLTEGIKKALRKEFRETIPTGIGAIDVLTGGGLGKSEIGVILTPSGVGKTTALTIIANTGYEQEKNVAQIIFEDTKDQIKRKHFTIWAKSALSRLNEDEENERVLKIAEKKAEQMEGKGRLIIKRFSQEDTTMKDVRNWMLGYQKKWGFKFDLLVLDYLDCLESHKKSQDRNESELTIIKGFEALASDFNIPAWTAIQSNRSGFGSEFVEAYQSGGSIKRVQKAHFFMSVAKTPAQQEANFANIRIIKARFAKDGQTFEDCTFNNDTLQIIIDDPRYPFSKTYKNLQKYDEGDVDRVEKKAEGFNTGKMNAVISQHTEGEILGKINNDNINDLLRENKKPEEIIPVQPLKAQDDTGILSAMNVVKEEESKRISEGTIEGTIEGANQEKLLEFDETEEIVNIKTVDNAVSDAVSDDVNDGVKPILLDWSGETFTHDEGQEVEVTINDIPSVVDVLVDNKVHEIIKAVESPIIKSSINGSETSTFVDEHEKKLETSDIEKTFIDPDAPIGNNKTVFDMLVKKRNYQHVMKKE